MSQPRALVVTNAANPTVIALDEAALAALAALRAGLRGDVILPGDADYESARLVWNGMIDKRPGLIARCAGPADVLAAVRFAREHELLVAVRGGGHNVAGNATCDGGMVIDLSRMRAVRVDPTWQIAWAEGGATWGDLDREAEAHGLATTGGAVSTTGIAGLTLGGGVGWLARKHGLACDNLLAADVVTADGRLLTASAEEHADLFWGLRGGGGNFGVVTTFAYRLHPLGTVLGGMVVHPVEQAHEVLRFFRAYAAGAPEELSALFYFFVAPAAPFLPPHVHGRPVAALAVCYAGPPEQGAAVLRPLRTFGAPLADTIQPMPYSAMQRLVEQGSVPRQKNYWKAAFFRALDDAAVEALSARMEAVRAPGPFVEIFQFNGAVNRVAPEATAFAHRHASFDLTIGAKWLDPAETEAQIAWVRETYHAVEPSTTGAVYVNYLGDEGAERVRAAYGANYDRLVALKRAYDPTNFFRLNQNIRL
jgi:FAD/FMN-containing dehydrogenase